MNSSKGKEILEAVDILKRRIISSGLGLILLVLVLYFINTLLMNLMISFISIIAVHEILLAKNYANHKKLSFLCYSVACLIPFLDSKFNVKCISFLFFIFIFLSFMLMLVSERKMSIEQVSCSCFMSIIIPFAFSSLVYIRNLYVNDNNLKSVCCVLLALNSACTTDTGAFFVGRLIGKHKFCESISPKKTKEGVAGGIAFSVIFCLIIVLIFKSVNSGINVNFIYLFLIAILASVLAIIGDLLASLVKRQCLIKDFGRIIPGHGGILDRFDSMLFVAPFYYLMFSSFNIIS